MNTQFLLVQIQVGLPQTRQDEDRTWASGIFKQPVSGPIWLGRTNLAGDGQADLKNHGGADKAVYAYPAEHYPDWRSELNLPDLPYGGFGENFTTQGRLEENVCIGDIYQVGSAQVQVAQPRRPCYKLNRRWSLPDLDARLDAARRCGWYLRVLQEGWVEAGQEFVLVERPAGEWDVDRVYAVRQDVPAHAAEAGALLELEGLAEDWRAGLRRKLAG